tara:strand:+ start:77 stop:607 length:531 start_codon:yes stop_codon:yes gene_type:complete
MTDICAICHEDLSDNLYSLPECNHTYHVNCIMHWFRTNHNTCPLCQNQGINYTQAYNESLALSNYSERILWKEYYKNACRYAKKKNADKEIVKRIKAIKKSEISNKNAKKKFREWKQNQPTTGLTNGEIMKQHTKLRSNKWKRFSSLRKRKIAIGYLYFHKFMKSKLIIAEKVQIN